MEKMNIYLTRRSNELSHLDWAISKIGLFSAFSRIAVCSMLLGILFSAGASGQAISPQMLQQLQTMPRAQQEALAKQYGVDLDTVLGGGGGAAVKPKDIAMPGVPLEQKGLVDPGMESAENYLLFQEKFAEFEKSLEKEKEEVKRYGVSIFDRDVSTFAPTDDASVPDNYRLGAGDNLVVQLFGTENMKYDFQVSRSGLINFPKLGPMTIAGLTFEDARELIQSRVVGQLLGAQATVSMGRLRAINIFMAGEVAVPGAYSVSALTTITQALFQSGGVGSIGSLRNIQVKRNGKTVETFDVYQLLLKGDASGDLRLRSGDVVFVPPYSGIVNIGGAVKRPMIYEFITGESVADAVAMAGGLNQNAYAAAIAVVSKAVGTSLPGAKNINLAVPRSANVRLRNGDQIRVPESTDNLENAVTLEGAVVRPGVYGWVKGQRISDLMSSIASDLKPYADLGYGLVVRQKNQQLDIEVLRINLVSALTDIGSASDILTMPRDKIIVFALPSVTDINAVDIDVVVDNDFEGEIDADDQVKADAEADADADMAAAKIISVQRLALLAPVIEKLRSQARSGEPVQLVSISGAVKAPGDYPLGENDTIATLIAASGGLKDSVYLESAELRTLSLSQRGGMESQYQNIDLNAELDSSSARLLRSRDHLFVRELPHWNPINAITLEGEVRFPGTYRISQNERLGEVIERAGGLTLLAFPEGAVFTRQSVADLEATRSKEFAQAIVRDFASSQLTKEINTIGIAEVQSIAEILQTFEGKGRLLVDIQSAINGDTNANTVLEDGDTLSIPIQTSTVTVVGEIRRPGTHSFQAGLSLVDYLSLSAGLTARADNKELYIVKANGAVIRPTKSWLRFSGGSASVSPGDTVVVPVDAGYTDNLSLWRDITQVIFNTTAGIASIAAAAK